MSPEGSSFYREYDHGRSSTSEPLHPSPLPPELAAFLRDQSYACLTHPTDRGTVLIAKVPAVEIQSVRGRIPIELRHELHQYPSAPVIRLVTTLFDQPRRPLALETFFNVDEPDQRADYQALTHQSELSLLFYDETLRHRLTKQLRNLDPDAIIQVLEEADRLHAAIPRERYDFAYAKQLVIASTHL